MDSYSAGQEIVRLLWGPVAMYRCHKLQLTDPVPTPLNTAHTVTNLSSEVRFNTTVTSTTGSSKLSPLFTCSD
jgi:hypothetical protein